MIEVLKIVNDIYDNKVAPSLHFNKTSVTRGNKSKLYNQKFIHNFRKHKTRQCKKIQKKNSM